MIDLKLKGAGYEKTVVDRFVRSGVTLPGVRSDGYRRSIPGKKEIKLAILVENDEAMLNFMSLIPVNPAKFPHVNAVAAMRFVTWATDPEKGQLIIRDFGKEKYGAPLFFPNSDAWRKRQGK